MKKALFMGLFFYVLGAGAMQELPQEWGEQEWENLKNNENVKSRLRENGIERYLCNAMMSDDDIETILSEFSEGSLLTRNCRLQEYLQLHLYKLVQIEFLQKIVTSIRDRRRFEVHLTRHISSDEPSPLYWFKATLLLKDVESEERGMVKAYFLLPRELKRILASHLHIMNPTHWKVWGDWLMKIF